MIGRPPKRNRSRPIQVYLDEGEEKELTALMTQHALSKSDTIRYLISVGSKSGSLRVVEENMELKKKLEHLKELNEEQGMVIEEMQRQATPVESVEDDLQVIIQEARSRANA